MTMSQMQTTETSPRSKVDATDLKLLKIFEKLKKNPKTKLTEFLIADDRTSNY